MMIIFINETNLKIQALLKEWAKFKLEISVKQYDKSNWMKILSLMRIFYSFLKLKEDILKHNDHEQTQTKCIDEMRVITIDLLSN